MGIERVLSMGERLQKILDDSENEAERIVAEAERNANEMISSVRNEAERKRNLAQRGSGIDELLKEVEEKAKVEATKILESYNEKAKGLKKLPENRMEEAVVLVLKEVLSN